MPTIDTLKKLKIWKVIKKHNEKVQILDKFKVQILDFSTIWKCKLFFESIAKQLLEKSNKHT